MKGDLMSTADKLTVICFDETYISSRICLDKKNERVIGPHKCVQTVIARGTYSNITINVIMTRYVLSR